MSLLRVNELTYNVAGRSLVARVSFEAASSSLLAICGPNGAGKSTLLRLLSGETQPSGGHIEIDGMPLSAISTRQLAAKRAVMPQQSRLAFAFTAFEVARLGADGIGAGLTNDDRDRLAEDALTAADAVDYADRNYQTLSGGEQQRVNFARALTQLAAGATVSANQFLLLDEPTASLDLKHQLALMRHARALADTGLLVIAVMHDLMLARSFTDRILLLQDGALAAIASRDEPLARAQIERVFGVTISESVCPPTPWKPGGSAQN